MTAPKPDVIDQAVSLAIEQLEKARTDYRLAHDSSYEERRGGRQGSGGSDRADVSRLLASKGREQRKVTEIAKAILRSCSMAQRAGTAFGEWTDLIDEGRDLTLTDPEVLRSVFRETRDSWAKNHAEGSAASARRAARGATLPGSDYGLRAG